MRDLPTLIVRWVHVLADAAKAAWYLCLRKWRFVDPIFAGVGSRPAVEREFVGVRRHLRRRLAGYPQFASEDPILRTLRQRAVLELFEWLGLEQIPKGYWTHLERLGDPARALTAFISNSGFDAMLVRKRDAAALAAFQSFVRFVCQAEAVTDLVPERQRTLLDRFMYYGEHAEARRLLELFVTLKEAADLFERWPGPRFAAFEMRARWATTLREHATKADLPEAKALLEAARLYAHWMGQFKDAEDRRELIEAATREQREALMPHDQALWADVLADLAQARGALMDDAVCDVQRQVEDFERSVERLVVLSDELSMWERDTGAAREGRQREEQARREEEAPRQKKRRDEDNEDTGSDREAVSLSRDELLSIFGFPPGALPELSALRQAFIREAGKTQPVAGQPDYRERNDRFRILKDSYERLKIALD